MGIIIGLLFSIWLLYLVVKLVGWLWWPVLVMSFWVGVPALVILYIVAKGKEDKGKVVGWSEEDSSKPKPKPKRDSKGRFIKQQDEEET